MNSVFARWFGAIFTFASFGVGAERPKLPAPGVDLILTQGKSAREFFAERTKDSPCRRQLLDLRAKYKLELDKFKTLKQDGATAAALDDQGLHLDAARKAVVIKNNECGECAARPTLQTKIQGVGRTEVWYESHGSCQLPLTNAADLAKAYDVIRDAILRVKKYPHYADGLHHILELKAIGKDWKEQPEVDLLPTESQRVFVSIRGPEIFGLMSAFSYLCDVTWKDLSEKNYKALSFEGTGVGSKDFSFPEVYLHKGSGEIVAIPDKRQKKASQLLKSWYLTQDGYLRYFTAADFGASISFIDQLGQEVMLDSIYSQYRRAIPE